MSDVRAPFPSLADATGVGAALTKSLAGDASTGKIGSVGFAYIDSSGNLILPQLDGAGRIPVNPDNGVDVSAESSTAVTGSTSAFQAVATITLVASKVYRDIEATLACYNDTVGQIVFNNNGVNTVLGWIFLGPGQFTFTFKHKHLNFTAGATGTQQLLLQAKNLVVVSDLHGTISAQQNTP